MFDRVVVGVATNSAKSALLTVDQRVDLARAALVGLDGVSVVPIDGLLADFLRATGADAVVKGLRSGADFDAELPMALMNRHLAGVETVFVVGDPALAHIASSLVKDVARHGGNRREHPLIADALLAQTVDHARARALRGHSDAGNAAYCRAHCASQLRISGSCALCVRSICRGVIDT